MPHVRRQQNIRKTNLAFEKLELKRCLASMGWDGAGQGSVDLSYYIGDAPEQIDQVTFENVIEKALAVWSDVADIEFTQTTTPRQADSLDITFASLDGAGGVLAQAYFPDDVNRSQIAGDIQFDVSENWEVGNSQGSRAFDLMYVAVHEIGHALGLEHSDIRGSVLNSTVSPNQQFTALANSDRDAALALYAPATLNPKIPTTVNPTVPPSVDTTNQGGIDNPLEPDTEEPAHDTEPQEPSTNDRDSRWNRVKRWRANFLRFLNRFQNQFESDSPFRSAFKFRFFRIR